MFNNTSIQSHEDENFIFYLRVQPRVVARPHAGDLAFVPRRRAHHPVAVVRNRTCFRNYLIHLCVGQEPVNLKHTGRDILQKYISLINMYITLVRYSVIFNYKKDYMTHRCCQHNFLAC